jgi:hypothetical protein
MALLLTAAAAARIEKSGNDLADICGMLSADRRYRGLGCMGIPEALRSGELLPFKREALIAARRTVAANKAVRSVDVLCRRGDTDEVELLRVGARGGWTRITRIWDEDGLPV